ncbi:MAG: prolipoprotein diacylglyceryl transferase [Clostridia bacterium]|nr:prolipoprotein diacylglyceryl transferase [Clostridia bacterium]
MTNYISFPGIGIEEFGVNEIAFSLFGIDVMWYGVIITLGIILAVLYVMNRAKYEGLTQDDILDYAIFVIPLAVVGARMYYVLTSLEKYDSFKEMLNIRGGGLAIYGAVIGGALTALVVSLVKKVKVMKMYDMLVPAVMIGQLIGRWGNFINAEAYGGQTDIFLRMGIRTANMSEAIYVHPTFLYESLWNLLGFLLINAYYKKKKYHGEIFFMYITWYGIGRFFIEGLRTDSLYVGPFRISQVIGIVSFVIGAFCLVYMYVKRGRNATPILEIENNNINKIDENKEN